MLAIVLTFDRQLPFAELLVRRYRELWPEAPLAFRVPYNGELPAALSTQQGVELRQTPRDIRSTVLGLLEDVPDAQWIFWTIDDRYPIGLKALALDAIVRHLDTHPDTAADAVRLVENPAVATGEPVLEIGGVRFRVQERDALVGFYMHHFVRAGVLRRLFLAPDLPAAYSIDDFHRRLAAHGEEAGRILVPHRMLAGFGEPCVDGRLTVNGAIELRRLAIAAPLQERGDQVIVYGDRWMRWRARLLYGLARLGLPRTP